MDLPVTTSTSHHLTLPDKELQCGGEPLTQEVIVPLIRSGKAVQDKAFCTKHRRYCRLERADVHWAGIICVSWSPMGKQDGEAGRDFVLWAAWAATRRMMQAKVLFSQFFFQITQPFVTVLGQHSLQPFEYQHAGNSNQAPNIIFSLAAVNPPLLQEPIIVYECSDRYDPSIMTSTFDDLYVHISDILCATNFGMVGTRSRCWGVLLHRETVMSTFASLKNVIRLFFREREPDLSFRCIMTATEEEVTEDIKWLRSRPMSLAKDMSFDQLMACPNPSYAALTLAEQRNMAHYHDELHLHPKLAIQLNQNALRHPQYSRSHETLHTIIKNANVIWCDGRVMTPNELAQYQAFPVQPHLTNPRGTTQRHGCSFSMPSEPGVKRAGRTAKVGQVGNSMNHGVCGSIENWS
jgi:hypothetical protein